MRSTTEFVAPPGGVSPPKPPPRLAPNEFTMSTPTIIKVDRTVMKPRAAPRERNIPQSPLREMSMALIVACARIEEHPDDPLPLIFRWRRSRSFPMTLTYYSHPPPIPQRTG